MNLRRCAREQELSEVLRVGHWPEACDPQLREHVNSCEPCGELVLLSQAFQASRADAMSQANLSHPGTLWWRAQLRRRNEAVQKLSQPTQWFSRIALLGALVVTVGFLAWQRAYVGDWIGWLSEMPHSSSLRMDSLWGAAAKWNWTLLLGCIGSLIGFGAVALFVSTNKE